MQRTGCTGEDKRTRCKERCAEDREQTIGCSGWGTEGRCANTVNPALSTSSFVWQILLSLFHISLFKVIKRKYFSQGKCEFFIFLFVLLDKIKIVTLETVYLPHQLLYMLFLAPLKNV